MDRNCTRLILGATLLALAATPVFAQFQKPMSSADPPPPGKRLEAHDGDTILVRDGGRIGTIRRSEGTVRAIYDPVKRWVLVLVDYADPAGAPPDGKVDGYYRFENVDGSWPLGERWDGSAVIDDYAMLPAENNGLGLTTTVGTVQLLGAGGQQWFRDARAVSVLSFHGAGHGNSPNGRQSFDEAERQGLEQLARDAEPRGARGSSSTYALPNGGTATARVGMSIESTGGVVGSVLGGAPNAPPPPPPPPSAPVRVGGNLKTPGKVLHVPPVLPAEARQAGITGVVILEIVIAPDGMVRDAKVLRSIPPLDAAALEAVRQWRYEPTLLNGVPVPVIMTVTVSFQ
jgi:TonB family protein